MIRAAARLLETLPRLLLEQDELQPLVPTVPGSVDYRTWRERLERIDAILRTSRAEELFVWLALDNREHDRAARSDRAANAATESVVL
jgi:hypothetical protein